MNIQKIPKKLLILDYLVPMELNSFKQDGKSYTLSPCAIENCDEWMSRFWERINIAVENKKFLPILRCSDGEYKFLFGEKIPSGRTLGFRYFKTFILYFKNWYLTKRTGFKSQTSPGVSSGTYSRTEQELGKKRFEKGLMLVLNRGILAAHLTFSKYPFQEQYHPSLEKWLLNNGLELHSKNYIPFYFIYALLSGYNKFNVFKDRKLLIINSATGAKRKSIEDSLLNGGAASINWITISSNKSLFEDVRLDAKDLQTDICMLGAGVGKFGIISGLSNYKGPVIDAGFMFEVWYDSSLAKYRPYCRA